MRENCAEVDHESVILFQNSGSPLSNMGSKKEKLFLPREQLIILCRGGKTASVSSQTFTGAP